MPNPPDPIISALIFAAVFTLVATVIEILHFSESNLRCVFNSKYWLFLGIQLIGNLIVTILAVSVLDGYFKDSKIVWWSPPLIAFAGVFAFEGVLSNTNINIFDKKVLAIQDLINKAKNPAIDTAKAKNFQYEEDENVQIANKLHQCCPLKTIDTHLLPKLTQDERNKIKREIIQCNADEHLYKSIELVSRDKNKAKALLKEYKTPLIR